jgi:hypothetical protein
MDKVVLIRKVLMNEASEEERAEVHAWIASDPRNADEFEDLKLFYKENTGDHEPEHSEEFYEPLKKIQVSIKLIKQKKRKLRFFKTAGISTVVSCFFFAATVYFFNSKITAYNNVGNVSGITLSAELKFKDAPLSVILKAIEKKNQIVFTEPTAELLKCRFTGTFCKGAAIGDVMDILAESEKFQYVFKANNIVLTGKGCSH